MGVGDGPCEEQPQPFLPVWGALGSAPHRAGPWAREPSAPLPPRPWGVAAYAMCDLSQGSGDTGVCPCSAADTALPQARPGPLTLFRGRCHV